MIRIVAVLLIVIAMSSHATAETAICKIQIEDFHSGNKYFMEEKFEFSLGFPPSKKIFDLPGSDRYRCRFIFFDLKTGTALSCEDIKTKGHSYFQSDRGMLEENNPKNYLTFRDQNLFYIIKTSCD